MADESDPSTLAADRTAVDELKQAAVILRPEIEQDIAETAGSYVLDELCRNRCPKLRVGSESGARKALARHA